MKKKLYLNSFASANGDDMKAAVEPTMVKTSIPDSSKEPTVIDNLQNGQNLAEPTKKKSVNWLLIGGFFVGGLLLFKYLKKG